MPDSAQRAEPSGEAGRSELGRRAPQLESRVLALLAEAPLGRAAIERALGERQPSGALHATLRQFVATQAVALTLPDKPTSRLQKYRLTPKGRARLRSRPRVAS